VPPTHVIIIALVVNLAVAVAAHALVKSYPVAVFLGGGLTSVVWQFIAHIQLGYLDPFFPIALVVGWMISMPISILTGVPFLMKRNARLERERRALAGYCPHCGYDLRATPDKCPDCGTRATTPA
jgi:hypothetical protein